MTSEDIDYLKAITHKGANSSARTIMHANILLHMNDLHHDRKKDNSELAEIFDIFPNTINQVSKTYATEGLQAFLCLPNR